MLDGLNGVHSAVNAYSPKMQAVHDTFKGMTVQTDDDARPQTQRASRRARARRDRAARAVRERAVHDRPARVRAARGEAAARLPVRTQHAHRVHVPVAVARRRRRDVGQPRRAAHGHGRLHRPPPRDAPHHRRRRGAARSRHRADGPGASEPEHPATACGILPEIEEGHMSDKKAAVERVLRRVPAHRPRGRSTLLTDDVVWDLPGYKHLDGQARVRRRDRGCSAIRRLTHARAPTGSSKTGDTSRSPSGRVPRNRSNGETVGSCTATSSPSSGDLIRRVESYLVPLELG